MSIGSVLTIGITETTIMTAIVIATIIAGIVSRELVDVCRMAAPAGFEVMLAS